MNSQNNRHLTKVRVLQYVRFSEKCWWEFESSGMWQYVAKWLPTVQRPIFPSSWRIIIPWRWRQHSPLKCWQPLTQWHSVTFQRTSSLKSMLISYCSPVGRPTWYHADRQWLQTAMKQSTSDITCPSTSALHTGLPTHHHCVTSHIMAGACQKCLAHFVDHTIIQLWCWQEWSPWLRYCDNIYMYIWLQCVKTLTRMQVWTNTSCTVGRNYLSYFITQNFHLYRNLSFRLKTFHFWLSCIKPFNVLSEPSVLQYNTIPCWRQRLVFAAKIQ